MDALLTENDTEKAGDKMKPDYSTRRVCVTCSYQCQEQQSSDVYLNVSIPEKSWLKGVTNIQDLVNNTFDHALYLEDGVKCPNCKSKEKSKVEEKQKLPKHLQT